jgi:hypothetical protein
MTLHAIIETRAFQRLRTPGDLSLKVKRISASDRQGFKAATIAVTGDAQALASVASWLRYGVKIINDAGTFVWGGYVNEIEISIQGVTATVSLDNMFNRVRIAYTYVDPNGQTTRQDTEWAQDPVSVSLYGTKELTVTYSEMSAATAEGLRDRLLGQAARPVGTPAIGGEDTQATLYCKGWLSTAEWQYYQNDTGKLEYTTERGDQCVGWRITASTDIGFVRSGSVSRIHDLGRRLNADGFKTVDRILITGSTSNNALRQFAATTSHDGAEISADDNTLTFEMNDDLLYSDLSGFEAHNLIRVVGSTWNDGTYLHDTGPDRGNTHLTVSESFGSFQQGEQPDGYTVTVTQGNSIELLGSSVVNEFPGASITVALAGLRLAQEITLPNAWIQFGKCAIKVRKVGTPADNLYVRMYSNSAGAPGSVLAEAYLTPAEIGTEAAWKWFDFTTDSGGAASTLYWLVIERAGSYSPTDYYVVTVDSETGSTPGGMILWDGATWQDFGWNLCYRLWAEEDTGTQIRTILADACADYLSGVTLYAASGVLSPPWRAGDTVAMSEVEKLLDQGTSSGQRLRLRIDDGRAVLIDSIATTPPTVPSYTWTPTGVMGLTGAPIDEGALFAGEWLRIAWPGNLADTMSDISWMYVEEIDYDGSYTISPAGARGWRQGLEAG